MRRIFTLLAVSLLSASLGACNTVASLNYVPPAGLRAVNQPVIGTIVATDQRKEDPHRLATILGGFGNPVKTLDTKLPVKDEVAEAFHKGLRARGLLAPGANAPLQLALTIRKFDSDMMIGRTARIDLALALVDASGRTVYEDSAVDSQSDMKFFETGIFADIADLQVLCEAVLSRTVDRLLDKPAFREALAGKTS